MVWFTLARTIEQSRNQCEYNISVTTHFQCAFNEPLCDTFWKEFCRIRLNEANGSDLRGCKEFAGFIFG